MQDPIAEEKLEQQQQQLSPGEAGNLVVAGEEQHEEILANFDSFLKLAGSELISVRDMAKNMTGRGEKYDLNPTIFYFIRSHPRSLVRLRVKN